uniref:Uncharacterized protein n=1 Tax=Anguilla anguilla TaxID=7936 RepID=A0A0E9XTZ0_ANGAN
MSLLLVSRSFYFSLL